MSERILVVEDDRELGEELVRQLREAGYSPTWIDDGDRAMKAEIEEYSLVLLDLVLPGTYGFDVLKRIRSTSEVPVILLTARDFTADKVRGLQLGADDYMTKPFWPDELLARVKARLRRPVLRREGAGTVRAGSLVVDLDALRVFVGDAEVELTKVEFALLARLAKNAGRALSRVSLAEHALDEERGGSERTLDVHISRLRKKLGDEGKRIATVWGIGYRLEKDV